MPGPDNEVTDKKFVGNGSCVAFGRDNSTGRFTCTAEAYPLTLEPEQNLFLHGTSMPTNQSQRIKVWFERDPDESLGRPFDSLSVSASRQKYSIARPKKLPSLRGSWRQDFWKTYIGQTSRGDTFDFSMTHAPNSRAKFLVGSVLPWKVCECDTFYVRDARRNQHDQGTLGRTRVKLGSR